MSVSRWSVPEDLVQEAMAGVLGNFIRHSRARQELQKRRETLKAERTVSVGVCVCVIGSCVS